MDAEVDVGEIRDIRAEDDERAVQDVDDVQHAPDQRETHRDARIKAAENQAIRSDLEIDHVGFLGPKLIPTIIHCVIASEAKQSRYDPSLDYFVASLLAMTTGIAEPRGL